MPRWLVDCRVDSELTLEPGQQIQYSDPITGLDALISLVEKPSNGQSQTGEESLSFQVIVEAPDAETAEDEATARLVDALDLITAFTGAKAAHENVAAIIDWTPGVTPRRGLAYGVSIKAGQAAIKADVVLPRIQELLHSVEIPEQARRAVRWIRKGVIEPYAPEQFIFFWTALEIIADLLKPVGDVEDICPFCGQALGHCPHCGKALKHRPYPGQAIRHLVCERLKQPDEFFEAIEAIRHAYVHGEDLDALERTLQREIGELADRVGLLVLDAFLMTLRAKQAGTFSILRAETLRHYGVRAVAHFGYEPDPHDLWNPDPTKIPKFNLEVLVSRKPPDEEEPRQE